MQQHIVWQHSNLYSICSMPQCAIHLPNAKQCSTSQHVALQHMSQLHLQQLCKQQCTLHQHARQHCVQLRYASSVGPIKRPSGLDYIGPRRISLLFHQVS
jgi:hypothetical protein